MNAQILLNEKLIFKMNTWAEKITPDISKLWVQMF